MNKKEIIQLLEDIIKDRGIPKNIKASLDESIQLLNNSNGSEEEKIAHITSILDEASEDPNIPTHARTKIWNAVSVLEEINRKNANL